MGEAKKRPLRLHFDRRLKLEFHGARVRRAVGPVGSGRCLPRGVAQGRYCLAHDAYASSSGKRWFVGSSLTCTTTLRPEEASASSRTSADTSSGGLSFPSAAKLIAIAITRIEVALLILVSRGRFPQH